MNHEDVQPAILNLGMFSDALKVLKDAEQGIIPPPKVSTLGVVTIFGCAVTCAGAAFIAATSFAKLGNVLFKD